MPLTKGMERISRGIYYGYLPKIGSNGLAINADSVVRESDWQFKFSQMAIMKLRASGEQWFQVYSKKPYNFNQESWDWFHGLVDARGKILQIG